MDKGASNLLNLVFPFSGTAEFRSLAHIESYFAQGEFSFYDQLVVNAGIRNDGFSTFGASSRRHNFPKASAAWTFTNALGNGPKGLLSYGKLHFAYGETGKEPPLYAAVTTLTSGQTFGSGYNDVILSSINGQGGLVTSQTQGNPRSARSAIARMNMEAISRSSTTESICPQRTTRGVRTTSFWESRSTAPALVLSSR